MEIFQTTSKKKLGYISFWKDKSKGTDFIRPVIKTTRGFEEAGIVIARALYPDIDLKDKKIFYLDGDKTNLDPENICIVDANVFNQMLNNKLLSTDSQLNKLAIETLKLNEAIKSKK